MPGPAPKPAHLRQRTNKVSTAATLPSEEVSAKRPVPALPPRERQSEVWHPRVVEWWRSVWTAPMAAEYLGPDILGGLHLLAELYQRLWAETESNRIVAIAAEIRQQEVRFGLTPIDRRRLQWEVEKGEVAEERTSTRRRARTLDATSRKDPREVLKVVG